MKHLIVLFFILIVNQGYSQSTNIELNKLNCKSANYQVFLEKVDGKLIANYGINDWINDGADVTIEELYASKNIITLSLNVDGQAKKFELTATRTKQQANYLGKLYTGKVMQIINCTI
jgi:hypothetical protein